MQHDEPPAAAVPTVETSPPPPANSVYDKILNWKAGEMRDAFLKLARRTGSRNDAFIADRVLKENEHWMVKTRKLGEGSFGCVWAMWVPTLDETFALKTFSAVRIVFLVLFFVYLSFFKEVCFLYTQLF